MDTGSPTTRTTKIRYPDKRKGPFLISGEWRWLQEQWQLVGYSQGFADEADLRELQTEDARALRLPLIKARSALELARQLRAEGQGLPVYRLRHPRHASSTAASCSVNARKQKPLRPPSVAGRAGRRCPGRAPAGGPYLRRGLSRQALSTKAVAEQLGISYAAATKRVASCRKVGILGRPNRARPASSAHGTGQRGHPGSLLAAKEIMAARTAELEGDSGVVQPDEAPGGGGGIVTTAAPVPTSRRPTGEMPSKECAARSQGAVIVQRIGPSRAAPGQEEPAQWQLCSLCTTSGLPRCGLRWSSSPGKRLACWPTRR